MRQRIYGIGHDTVEIFGVRIQAWDERSLIDGISRAALGLTGPLGPSPVTVHYANIHVLNTAYRNCALRRQLNRASTVYCDGSGVRLGALLLGSSLPDRTTAADWFTRFCARAAHDGLRLYLLGGADGVAARAGERLAQESPGLRIVGAHHGFLGPKSSAWVVDDSNQVQTDVLIVGMGTPLQEHWVHEHREYLEAPVVWTVGALLDFVTGEQRRAPKRLRRHHLEWAWRLATDPLRLGRRYLIGNPLFCARVLRQRLLGTPQD